MQVILTKDVDTLGTNGDVVDVADGFARNYLFPRKMAVQCTPGSMSDLKRRIDRLRAKQEKKHQEDLAKAEQITTLGLITINANAGEGGKLYGTITTKQLTEVLQEKTGLALERRNVNVDRPISKVGDYTVFVKLSPKVSAQVALQVNPIEVKREEFVLADAFEGDEEFYEEEYTEEYTEEYASEEYAQEAEASEGEYSEVSEEAEYADEDEEEEA